MGILLPFSIFFLIVYGKCYNLNYEDAVRIRKNHSCPVRAGNSSIVQKKNDSDWRETGLWRSFKDFKEKYKSDYKSESKRDLYSSMQVLTGTHALGSPSNNIEDTSRLLQNVVKTLNPECEKVNRSSNLSSETNSSSESESSSETESESESDSSENEDDETYRIGDYQRMWKKHWTEVSSNWFNSYTISDVANGWAILKKKVTSNNLYSQFVEDWTDRSDEWLQDTNRFNRSRDQEIISLGYFGFLVAMALETTNHLQCSVQKNEKSQKDMFLQVAEEIIKSDFNLAKQAIERDRRFCHDGHEWKVDAASGSLVMTADFTLDGVMRSIDSNDSGIAPKLQLGHILDEMFERAFNREQLRTMASQYSLALLRWQKKGPNSKKSKPVMSPELQKMLRLGHKELSVGASEQEKNHVIFSSSKCSNKHNEIDSPYLRWVVQGIGLDSMRPTVRFECKRAILELLRTGSYLSLEEYEWLERLVTVYEQWTVDLTTDQTQTVQDKLVNSITRLSPQVGVPYHECTGIEALVNRRIEETKKSRSPRKIVRRL